MPVKCILKPKLFVFMFKKKISYGDAFIIIANLVPLFGVWFGGWDPRQMFLIYCFETIIIGGYNVVKMIIVSLLPNTQKLQTKSRASAIAASLFLILFFIVHYGFFVFIQTSIFAGVSGLTTINYFSPLSFIPGLFDLITKDTKLVLYCFILMYGLKMVTDFLLTGTYKNTSLTILMFQPYLRIFVQQFVVILGSMFLAFGAGKYFMVVFVLVKIYAEVYFNYDRYLEVAEKKNKPDKLGRLIN